MVDRVMDLVSRALDAWGMTGAEVSLAAERENRVFKVEENGAAFALRLHRQGYRSDRQLRSELMWMRMSAHEGMSVPLPVPDSQGRLLIHLDAIQVDVLTWLAGSPLGTSEGLAPTLDRRLVMLNLGAEMAALHRYCDVWHRPDDFERPAWDTAGLLGDAPLWGRFWDNPTLTDRQKNLFRKTRDAAHAQLAAIENELDYGLIHADLIRENVLVNDNDVSLIDFDDGGFGFRLFDVATSLVNVASEPDFEKLEEAFLAGYRSIRNIDTAHLPLFMLIRSLTYVGWVMPRLDEAGGAERNRRSIERALSRVHAWWEA